MTQHSTYDKKKISFIIPIYEVAKADLYRCLNSIYSQIFDNNIFEVICVDDCSPSNKMVELIKSYRYRNNKPENLIFIRHDRNRRQGGARNTAIEIARGEYVFYIDQDDWLYDGSIKHMINSLTLFPDFDIIMFDSGLSNENGVIMSTAHYAKVNSTQTMSGNDFICHQEIPWTPWHYLYNRKYLIENGFRFEENVRFEDKDYVMRCTVNAKRIVFIPITAIIHTVSSTQQSMIGNDVAKITDLFKITYRTGLVANEEFEKGNERGAYAIMSHHDFSYKSLLKKYAWRLPYKKVRECLIQYYPFITDKSDYVLKFIREHPQTASKGLFFISPFMHFLYASYKFSKKLTNH